MDQRTRWTVLVRGSDKGNRIAIIPVLVLSVILLLTSVPVLAANNGTAATSSTDSALATGTTSGNEKTAGTGSAQSDIQLSATELTLTVYEKTKLKLSNAPGKVTWVSSDEQVATVSGKGKVQTKAAGKCKITAKCEKKKYVCRITVVPFGIVTKTQRTKAETAAKKVESAGSSETSQKLALQQALTNLTPTQSIEVVRGRQADLCVNHSTGNPQWTSSDEKVARVDAAGLVQTISSGKCVITATYKDAKAVCEVTVMEISPATLRKTNPAGKTNKGKILLAGSSSMDFWNSAPQAFAPYEVINMAIGGTTVVQWLEWYHGLIVRYKPSAVVLYVGSNDLGGGGLTTGEQNAANTILLLKRLKRALKKTPIFYVGVSPCWSRKGAWQDIAVSNKQVKDFCEKAKYLYYIDIASACAAADGTPRHELFLADRLHPSEAGYAVWTKVVAGTVKKTLRSLEKAQARKKSQK